MSLNIFTCLYYYTCVLCVCLCVLESKAHRPFPSSMLHFRYMFLDKNWFTLEFTQFCLQSRTQCARVSRGAYIYNFRTNKQSSRNQFIHANHPLRYVFINFIFGRGLHEEEEKTSATKIVSSRKESDKMQQMQTKAKCTKTPAALLLKT